jgi:hypothetical protein
LAALVDRGLHCRDPDNGAAAPGAVCAISPGEAGTGWRRRRAGWRAFGMAEEAKSDQFWIGKIIGWLITTAGIRQDQLQLGARFIDSPYDLTYVNVLNLMDHLVSTCRAQADSSDFTLSQNWRLAHRGDTVGDFIVAFLAVVKSESAGRPKRSGIG